MTIIARVDEEYKKALHSRSCPVGLPFTRVSGVGILTAAILAADLPELGEGDGKWTSLVGLAPVTAAASGAIGPSGASSTSTWRLCR